MFGTDAMQQKHKNSYFCKLYSCLSKSKFAFKVDGVMDN